MSNTHGYRTEVESNAWMGCFNLCKFQLVIELLTLTFCFFDLTITFWQHFDPQFKLPSTMN